MKRRSHLKRFLMAIVAVFVVCGLYGAYHMWRLLSTWMEGKRLYESHNYAGAARAFREHSALIPDDAEGHYWLGNALGFSNQLDKAVPELQQAAQLEPKNFEYRYALGNTLQMLKRDAEAEQAFRAALALRPNDPELHVSLGFSLYRQNRRNEGIREWRQALQLDPGNQRAQKALWHTGAP